jgi:acyl dehydratase
MTDPIRSLDDLAPGQSWDLGTFSLPLEEVVAFASRYDPQFFHLDADAARDSIFGELVVSGLHTLSAVFGRVMGSGLLAEVSLGGNQIDSKWPAPLRPGEEVAVRVEVVEVRPSRSGRPLGIAKLRHTARRVADGVLVLDAVGTHFLRR